MVSKKRIVSAAKKYLGIMDYEYIGECGDFVITHNPEDDQNVFVHVITNEDTSKEIFISSDVDELRNKFEAAMLEWFTDNQDGKTDFNIRCDEICLTVLSDNRALVRHCVNVCG